jgi:hypothetical protein
LSQIHGGDGLVEEENDNYRLPVGKEKNGAGSKNTNVNFDNSGKENVQPDGVSGEDKKITPNKSDKNQLLEKFSGS